MPPVRQPGLREGGRRGSPGEDTLEGLVLEGFVFERLVLSDSS